jgi:predicted ATPase
MRDSPHRARQGIRQGGADYRGARGAGRGTSDAGPERHASVGSELYRLRGKLLLQQTVIQAEEAAICFEQALAVARRQQTRSWELRAAMSLARLWQRQGKSVEAHQLLAEVYGWFTEGFDTADLQEAKALLAGLTCCKTGTNGL